MVSVSVLIPVHNCEKWIRRSLDSVVAQTFKDFEVVIVDNNCTDNTMKIVEEYSEHLDLKIVECKDVGIEAALNTGLRNCSGKWIARQDGDDLWYPDKLQKQISFLNDNPDIKILGTQIRLLDVNGVVQEEGTMGKSFTYPTDSNTIVVALLYGQNAICHPSVVFSRDLINTVGGYEKLFMMAEDLHLWLKCIPHFKFANLSEVLVDYTQKLDDRYDARTPLIAADMYYNLYKTVGLVQGEREERVWHWQLDPNSHGNKMGG